MTLGVAADLFREVREQIHRANGRIAQQFLDGLRRELLAVSADGHRQTGASHDLAIVLHIAGLQRLKLGLVAECLNDLPTSLWDQPLANFTTSALAQLAGVPGIGTTRFEVVVAAVRGLAAEFMDLRSGTSVRLKFIPGPLRAAQDWIERTLEARVVPDLDELTIRLLRPMARQLQHDLTEREAQIAVHRLRLNESSAKTTLEELAAVHGVTRERIRQLEHWGPRCLS